MAGFNFGSASGLLNLEGKFDTKAGKDALSHVQDAKKSMSKLNEVTVGAFNKKTETQAVDTGEKKATELTEEQRNDLRAKVAAEYKKVVMEEYSDRPELFTETRVQLLADRVVEDMTDEELQAKAAEIEYENKSILERIGDSIGSPEEIFDNIVDQMKSNFCAASPFPACSSCPNRPKNKAKIPDVMGMISDTINSLMKGLEDAALALIGCPGLVNGLKSGLLTGDFSGLTNGIKAGAMSSLINTASSVGAAAVCGVIGNIVPYDMHCLMESKVGSLLKNTGATGYGDVCSVMTGFAIAGDNIMKTASLAMDGNIQGAYKTLTNGGKTRSYYGKHVGSTNTLYTRSNGIITARNATSSQTLIRSISSCLSTSKTLTSAVSTKNTRTRARFTANKMSNLPGTTLSVSTIKTAYAIDNITTGRRLPKGTKVRQTASASAKLF